ncbi:MAG: glycolate oxidase subunit GlcE [Gammaproteobacteria bacterium]|nr:glycolate oxidase subunit GlcE [Gammaproteobacteria bacterium]
MNNTDISITLAETVREAAERNKPLAIHGNGTKRFFIGDLGGEPLDVTGHRGIVSYEPTELVVSARAGTPLAEIEARLAEHNQMLAFEPPHFGADATLGGTIACGLSGPRRPYAGAARDHVLGVKMINGCGEILAFGGQVMKNVAGYDLSRLMVGALGTLGVLLEVSLKVLPKPASEITLMFELPADRAIVAMNTWAGRPLPLSAASHSGDTLAIRLSGAAQAVQAAHAKLGGEVVEKGEEFWRELREHRRGFFRDDAPLWRLSVPPAVPPLKLPGKWLIDWGGGQRWIKTQAPAAEIHDAAEQVGGHAAMVGAAEGRGTGPGPAALAPELVPLHRNLKQAFDPHAILNRAMVS